MRIKGFWRIKRWLYNLRELLFPIDNDIKWEKMLNGQFHFGADSVIDDANLVVMDSSNCELTIGEKTKLECNIVFEKSNAVVTVGDRSFVGGATLIDVSQRIEIGSDVMIGFQSLIMDHDSHSVYFKERQQDTTDWLYNKKDWQYVKQASVKICDKAWVGAHVKILKGITVGEGAVVALGSIVTKDVPAWTLVAGNPARIIKKLESYKK